MNYCTVTYNNIIIVLLHINYNIVSAVNLGKGLNLCCLIFCMTCSSKTCYSSMRVGITKGDETDDTREH